MIYKFVIFIFTNVFIGVSIATDPCYERKAFYKTYTMLHPQTDGAFLSTTTTSTIHCASVCERKNGCTSFFHNPSDNQCFLASDSQIITPDTSFPDSSENIFQRFRKPGNVTTCVEVQVCGNVNVDGEYWLYPTILQGQKVKVFCSEMNTDSPKEFITLPNSNYVNYPPECNLNCHGDTTSGCPGSGGGHADYTKIRIDIHTMLVDRKDRTFATTTGEALDYGAAKDCYNTIWSQPTDPALPCGPRGKFIGDTTGTGLKISPQTVWSTTGYKSVVIAIWSPDGKSLDLTCGGWCGGCKPGDFKLELNPAESVPEESATHVQCQ